MEFEQIGKRLEWLDEQQRQSKSYVGDLGTRLAALETSINALNIQFKTLSKELTEVSPISARIDQFEQMVVKQRNDLSKIIDSVEKATIKREQETLKVQQTQVEEIRKSIFEVGRSVNTDEIYKKLRDRTHEEQRLTTAVQDMRLSVEAASGQYTELAQALKALEDARRQDQKRIADLVGEIAAVRKRADDAREKASVHGDGIRNVENRIGELLETELFDHARGAFACTAQRRGAARPAGGLDVG